MKQKILVVLGPTASGKTALAEYLASVFDGELVNADSRQIYQGMRIGTAKASLETLCHLIDIATPDNQFTVSQYKKAAINATNDILARGRLPILVGGTGLYIRSVVENLEFPMIPVQHDLRARLEKKPVEELLRTLEQFDPIGARNIDRHNERRLVRALEVTLASGETFSSQLKKGHKLFDILQIGITIEKDELSHRIQGRVSQMIEQGLEDEVRTLVERYGWNSLLSTTIGYKEWRSFFEGKTTLNQVKEDVIKHTNQYVKKQLTWFNADKTIHWVTTKNEARRLVQKFLESPRI